MHVALWPLHFKPVIGKAFMLTVAKCNSAWVLEHTVHRHKQSQEISLEETDRYKKRTSRDSHPVKVLCLLLPCPHFSSPRFPVSGAVMPLSCETMKARRSQDTAWGILKGTGRLPGVGWWGLQYLPEWHRGFQ